MERNDYLGQVAIARKNAIAYYIKNDPIISDDAYNLIIASLEAYEKEHPEHIDPNSPTQTVGGLGASGLGSVVHPVPMLSLANVFSVEETLAWLKSRALETFFLEMKYDGIAASVVFEYGQWVSGATRGNGETGEDITHTLAFTSGFPREVAKWKHIPRVEVRGECVMPKAVLATLNAQGADLSDCRSAAGGAMTGKKGQRAEERGVRFLGYEAIADGLFTDHEAMISELKLVGFDYRGLPGGKKYSSEDVEEVYTYIQEIRESIPVDIDGLVLKVIDYKHREKLGFTGRVPNWAIALKFPAQAAVTTLLAVELQLGRTGVITPVAKVSPTVFSGVIVTSVTLHNFDEIDRLGIKIGDQVILERRGDVIPKITALHLEGKIREDIPRPDNCPECGAKTKQEETYIRCTNEGCGPQALARLVNFVHRDCMDIDDLGPEGLKELLKSGMKDWRGLYQITEGELQEVLGQAIGTKVFNNLLSSRHRPFHRFIAALGIREVGLSTARTIATHSETLQGFLELTKVDLMGMPAVGPETSAFVLEYIASEEGKSLHSVLRTCGFQLEMPEIVDAPEFSGRTFVITGSFETINRRELKEKLIRLGAKVAGSVSVKTDVVIVGESAGAKGTKALELGIEIWDESDVLNKVN